MPDGCFVASGRAGLVLHVVRMVRMVRLKESHVISQLGMHYSLITMTVNFVFFVLLMQSGKDQDFLFRSISGGIVGWMTLLIEIGLPEYRRHVLSREERGLLLLEKAGEPLRLQPPGKGAPKGFHLFLSHTWRRGQDQVHSLAPMLRLMVPDPGGIRLWLDQEQLKTGVSNEELLDAVNASDAILVFLTDQYVSSEFCRNELTAAYSRSPHSIIVLQEASADHGGITAGKLKKEIEQAIQKASTKGEGLAQETRDAMYYLLEQVTNGAQPLFWHRDPLFKRAVLKEVVQRLVAIKKEEPVAIKKEELAAKESASRQSEGTTKDDSVPTGLARAVSSLSFPDELKPQPRRKGKDSRRPIRLHLSPGYPAEIREPLKTAFNDAAQELGATIEWNEEKAFNPNDPGGVMTTVLCLHDDEGRGFFDQVDLVQATKAAFAPLMPHQSSRESKRHNEALRSVRSDMNVNKLKGNAKKESAGVNAILMYTTNHGLSYYMQEAKWRSRRQKGFRKKADELPVELLQHLFRPMWRMFPTDSMLQKVAAKSELSKLLESERSRDSSKPVKKGKVADSGGASDAVPSFCNQGAPSASVATPAGTPSKDLDLVPFEA